MEEIKLDMENLTKEEREQLLKLVERANKKDGGVWKPSQGGKYYYIGCDGGIYDTYWYAKVDVNCYSIGNCFKTKKEAEFALERHKVIVELERFAKENNENDGLGSPFALTLNNYTGYIDVTGIYQNCGTTIIKFSSVNIAKRAVEKIGANRIKKYYFGVKD